MQLRQSLIDELLVQALTRPDEEVCGLIGGRDFDHLENVYPVENVALDRCCRFEMSPKGQVDAMRRIRDAGSQWIAIYHSHPNGPAYPSTIDLERSAYPDLLYLIVAPQQPVSSQVRCFLLRDPRPSELALNIV
jgi:proteasome lid subunit RPN8/RPN11